MENYIKTTLVGMQSKTLPSYEIPEYRLSMQADMPGSDAEARSRKNIKCLNNFHFIYYKN